jgi:hypothetical protein
MRIQFKTLSRADRYLTCCKSAVLERVPEVDWDSLPSGQIRNAFCSGLGYPSYTELRRTVLLNLPEARELPDVESVRAASIDGFTQVLQMIDRAKGTDHLSNSPQLPTLMTDTVIHILSERGDLRTDSDFDGPQRAGEQLFCNRCGGTGSKIPQQNGWMLVPAKLFPFRYPPAGRLGRLCAICVHDLRTESIRTLREYSLASFQIVPELCLVAPPQFTPGELEEVYESGTAWGDVRDDDIEGPPVKLAEGIIWVHGLRHGGIRMSVDVAAKNFDGEILRRIFAGRDAHYYWFVDDDDEDLVYRACPEMKRNADRHDVLATLQDMDPSTVTLREETIVFEKLALISRTDEQIREDYAEYWNKWHTYHDAKPVAPDLPGWDPLPFPKTTDEMMSRAKKTLCDFHIMVEQELANDAQSYREFLLEGTLSKFETNIVVLTTAEPDQICFKHVPCWWLFEQSLSSLKQPEELEAFYEFGRGFAKNFDGVPVALFIYSDVEFLYKTSSPYSPNTILFNAYTMDGRTALAEMSYVTVGGHIRPSEKAELSTGNKLPLLEEAALKFMYGWLAATADLTHHSQSHGRARDEYDGTVIVST